MSSFLRFDRKYSELSPPWGALRKCNNYAQDKKIISNENELVKVFNKHYINIIEKSGGQKPTNIAKSYTTDNNKQAVELICNSYRNHPSIIKINSNITTKRNTNNNTIFLPVSSDEVRKLL